MGPDQRIATTGLQYCKPVVISLSMSEAVRSIIRHFLTGLVVVLVARMHFDEESATTVTEGLSVFLSGLVMWAIAKYGPHPVKAAIKKIPGKAIVVDDPENPRPNNHRHR